MDHEARNGTGSNDNEEYTNIYFIVGDRRETATYKANQVTDMELKGEWESFIASLRRKSFIDFPVVSRANFFIYLTHRSRNTLVREKARICCARRESDRLAFVKSRRLTSKNPGTGTGWRRAAVSPPSVRREKGEIFISIKIRRLRVKTFFTCV